MKTGDRVFIYHSMSDAAIVGVADVVGDGRPDPGNAKLAVADFRFRCRIEPPVTLREIKQSGLFDEWALVRQSRLSTMAVPDKFVRWSRIARARISECSAERLSRRLSERRDLESLATQERPWLLNSGSQHRRKVDSKNGIAGLRSTF